MQNEKNIIIVSAQDVAERVRFGIDYLDSLLVLKGYQVQKSHQIPEIENSKIILIGTGSDKIFFKYSEVRNISLQKSAHQEGFSLNSINNQLVTIIGADNSGVLYGCLALADSIAIDGKLPENIHVSDSPQMVLRGACIGLQKPYLLPERSVYEYPITPENFSWFYDKILWIKYLDMLVNNRMNTLYLWSGHPFASLIRLKDYPYAVEVDSATFEKNREIFHFITQEADKRGICIILSFYNIIVSKPFAEKNGLKTQDRNRPIIPLIADYTRKSIAEFVKSYPNVGLLVTLGEAMQGVGRDDIDWFTKTIIPGVKDGLEESGRTDQPPVILRAHDTYAPDDIAAAKPLYGNLYTMQKYNGEALTTYQPRGEWAKLHRILARMSPVLVENVHILANLEPFRYGADDFIQKCVQAMCSIDSAKALHIYPQASYWDWPYSADNTDQRVLQINRDWIWYAEWARYAWNSNRNRNEEILYWSKKLAEKYGCSIEAGKQILDAYEQSGEIAPKLLRRYGITDGNRQTLTLGMFMSQFIHPTKYSLLNLLYESESPPGEMITEYAKKEWDHLQHSGETPTQIAKEVIINGQKAVNSIDSAASYITNNKEEFLRLRNDMYCYNLLADFYSEKVTAALAVLRYKYSLKIADLDTALPHLEKSVGYFYQLAARTKNTYLYANSMQTSQRKIPVSGKDGKNKTWTELLILYQDELNNFKKNLKALKERKILDVNNNSLRRFKNADVTLLPETAKNKKVSLQKNALPFTDTSVQIKEIDYELCGLNAIIYDRQKQIDSGTLIHFKCNQDVKLLIGYFTEKDKKYLSEPQLEIDASANDYDQAETKIANAILIPGFPAVNVHAFSFKTGDHTLSLGKGECLVLGFIDAKIVLQPFDAALGTNGEDRDIDWLFQ
ncbi:MAG: hypothetical protein PW786_15680 [Arachidicoccus sp.]|nr:hypothetical protein [Arachidicoccus sp.]